MEPVYLLSFSLHIMRKNRIKLLRALCQGSDPNDFPCNFNIFKIFNIKTSILF